MKEGEEEICCKKFDPKPYDGKIITWKKKPFIKDKVISFFHIPLNFGRVIKRNTAKLKEAEALERNPIVLSDEKSLFYSNIYISSKKAIPNAKDVKLSGTFYAKVFEGPYKNMKQWIEQMKKYVAGQNKVIKNLYFFYTTCPKCAKKYGKNYVVLFAEI